VVHVTKNKVLCSRGRSKSFYSTRIYEQVSYTLTFINFSFIKELSFRKIFELPYLLHRLSFNADQNQDNFSSTIESEEFIDKSSLIILPCDTIRIATKNETNQVRNHGGEIGGNSLPNFFCPPKLCA